VKSFNRFRMISLSGVVLPYASCSRPSIACATVQVKSYSDSKSYTDA
jgi:hypothetical protein